MAAPPVHQGECYFEHGKTYCTEKEAIGSDGEILNIDIYYVELCAGGT